MMVKSDKMNLIATTFLVASTLLSICEARYVSLNINVALTVSEDSHKLSEDMVRICAQETDISMDELHKFRKNDFTNPSEASQCFAHCIYEQLGTLRDGVFVERDAIAILADFTDPKMLKYEKCQGIKGINKCETSFKIYKCRQEQDMGEIATSPPPSPPAPEVSIAPAAPIVSATLKVEQLN